MLAYRVALGALSLSIAVAGSAQLTISPSSDLHVNPWDVLEKQMARTVRLEDCGDRDCTIEALVLDNPAAGDCIEDSWALSSYTVDGLLINATQVAIKLDSDALLATRYYRALVRMPGPGLQRLCVRRSLSVDGLRFSVSIDRPETALQVARAARVSLMQDRSETELRFSPPVADRPGRAASSDAELADRLARSRGTMPISVAIRSLGMRLPISLGDRGLGWTDRSLFVQPMLLPQIKVQRDGKAVSIDTCARKVEGPLLVLDC